MTRKIAFAFAFAFALTPAAHADFTSTFEDLGVPANSFVNDAGASGFFVSGGNSFNNTFSTSFGGIWSGWAVSSTTDTTTPDFTNQYSAITGGGSGGSATYGVAFTFGDSVDPFHPDGSFVNLAAGTNPSSIDVTNTTYAYLAMRDGDPYGFSKKFGAGDFFRLTISGFGSLGGTGTKIGEVDFDLASGTNILSTWKTLDLSSLNGSASLRFGLESSDNDPTFGMNTPAFFAADNLVAVRAVPEPASLLLVAAGGLGLLLVRWRRVCLSSGNKAGR